MATADKNVLDALKRERNRVKGTLPLTPEERRLTGKAADAYAEKLTRELERFYLETARGIRAELMREDLTFAKQSRLTALLSAIEAQTVALHKAALDFSGKAAPLYYMRGVDTASGYLDSIGFGDIGFRVPKAGTLDADTLMGVRLHRDAVAVLADSLAQDLVMANLSIEQTAARFVREAQLVRLRDAQMTRAVAAGLVAGTTRREVSSDILNVLRNGVVENGLVDINGRKYKPEAYASLVARTRTREAVNQGRINFAAEYGVDLFEIDTHESACPYCRQYVGRVYSISGATEGFPKLQVMPPYHPHCKCNGYPVPLEHLESLPYFEALKRFSNKPNADFEEFLAHKQDLLAGYKFRDSGHATSGGIVLQAGQADLSPISPGRGFMRTDKTGVPKGDYPELKKILGNRLQVEGYDLDNEDGKFIRRHLADMDNLPKNLLQKVIEEGLKGVIVGPGSIAQLPGYGRLAKVQASGYPVGTTWLDLSGCYDQKGRAILLGTSPVVEPHVVPHEFSHALVDSMGYADDFRVVKCYEDLADDLSGFYVRDGVPSRAGRDEFLADVLAGVIISGEEYLKGYPDYFVEFVMSVALKGKSPRAR